MTRSQFTFYDSFYTAIARIRKAQDRAAAYDAICAYALRGIQPDLENLPDAAAIAFLLSKPNLDASRQKAENGKLRKSKEQKIGEEKLEPNREQNESKTQAKPKQTKNKPEANRQQEQTRNKKEKEIELEKEIEIENECYNIPPVSPKGEKKKNHPALPDYSQTSFSPEMIAKVDQWLDYKAEKRQSYQPSGMKSLLSQIEKQVSQYGESAVMSLMDDCMAANYQGIIWERLGRYQDRELRDGRQLIRQESSNPFLEMLREEQG